MHSEKFVCVRENKHSSKSSLKIIDLRKGTEVSEKPMTADSAIMNPSKPHLALRGNYLFEIESNLFTHFSPKHNSSF